MNTLARGAVCLLALAIGLGQSSAGATEGQRPSKWWQSGVCKNRVGLSEAQAAELERIFQSVRDELRAEKGELEKQEATLSRLLAESTDEAVVVRTIDRVEAARSALAKTRTLMLYRMHRLLSREQRARLDAFEREQTQAAEAAAPRSTRPRE